MCLKLAYWHTTFGVLNISQDPKPKVKPLVWPNITTFKEIFIVLL